MIDIDTYRRRFGCFRSTHESYSGSRKYSARSICNVGVYLFCLSFVIYIGLMDCCFNNYPGIESNPGPFSSNQERTLFLQLKKVYQDISQVSCHQMFLRACETLDIVPRGFRNEKLSLASCKPNNNLITSFKSINAASEKEKVGLVISHYEKVITQLVEQKEQITLNLAAACTSRDRFDQLIAELDAAMIRDRDNRMLRHNKKLNTLLDTDLSATKWLPSLLLTSLEKSFITNNEYLCDRIIDAAMKLLQNANPELFIQCVLLQPELLIYSVNPTVHIHHIGGNHFVTTSTIGNPSIVTIYDSMNTSNMDIKLQQQITAIYSR